MKYYNQAAHDTTIFLQINFLSTSPKRLFISEQFSMYISSTYSVCWTQLIFSYNNLLLSNLLCISRIQNQTYFYSVTFFYKENKLAGTVSYYSKLQWFFFFCKYPTTYPSCRFLLWQLFPISISNSPCQDFHTLSMGMLTVNSTNYAQFPRIQFSVLYLRHFLRKTYICLLHQ